MSTPMPKSVQIVVNGEPRTFQIRKMNVLKSAAVSKELAAVILPIISGLKVGAQGANTASVDSFLKSALTFDVGSSVEAVAKALTDMEEAKLEKLLLNLFSTTSVVGKDGSTVLPLGDIETVSIATDYDHEAVLKLALEVAEYCLPFGAKAKSLIGAGMQAIAGFGKQTESNEETRTPLDASED